MKKEDLLKFCRYYHGEDNKRSNDHDIQMLLLIERAWVTRMLSENDFGKMLNEYIAFGLKDFEMRDDTPLTLKAMLFNRFCQYEDRVDTAAFKSWYRKYYK